MIGWILVAALAASAQVGPFERAPFAQGSSFSQLPVPSWQVRLPGPQLAAASHAERGGPVILGDLLYVGSAADDALLVLDRRNGDLVRRLPAGGPVLSPAIIDGDRVFFADGAGDTWCYSTQDGELIWQHTGSAPVVSSPRLSGGQVVVSSVDDVVVSLDAATGELRWRHAQKLDPSRAAELELLGAPTPLVLDTEAIAGFSDGTVAAFDPDTGSVLWQRRIGEGAYPDIIADPVVVAGALVVGGYNKPLVAMDRQTHQPRWRLDIGGAQAPLVAGGQGSRPDGSSTGTFLFHGGGDGILRCIDGRSGDILWSFDTHTHTALTSPVLADAGLFVGASGGSLYLLDPATGALLWRLEPGYQLSGFTAAPVVAGRQLIALTNAGNVLSFVSPELASAGD